MKPPKLLVELLARRLVNPWVQVNERPVIVLGNQKSGTSAIAHLLADYGGLSKTIDIPPLWIPAGARIMKGARSFDDVVRAYRAYFASDLIKEPMMTFFAEAVLERFPQATYVFIVRDPRDNIRSLLNSRAIPGHLSELTEQQLPSASQHRMVADPDVWGGKGENYVGVLAHRWNRAVQAYFSHAERMHLVTFEDFLEDKYGCIAGLAGRVGISKKQDIGGRLDVQYQPRGNRSVSWRDFFGESNLARIEDVCSHYMSRLSYERVSR